MDIRTLGLIAAVIERCEGPREPGPGHPPAETVRVLATLPARFHAGINDVLLCALALAITAWREDGQTDVLLDVEGHGREEQAQQEHRGELHQGAGQVPPHPAAPGRVVEDPVRQRGRQPAAVGVPEPLGRVRSSSVHTANGRRPGGGPPWTGQSRVVQLCALAASS